jgi:hypothetical protein
LQAYLVPKISGVSKNLYQYSEAAVKSAAAYIAARTADFTEARKAKYIKHRGEQDRLEQDRVEQVRLKQEGAQANEDRVKAVEAKSALFKRFKVLGGGIVILALAYYSYKQWVIRKKKLAKRGEHLSREEERMLKRRAHDLQEAKDALQKAADEKGLNEGAKLFLDSFDKLDGIPSSLHMYQNSASRIPHTPSSRHHNQCSAHKKAECTKENHCHWVKRSKGHAVCTQISIQGAHKAL